MVMADEEIITRKTTEEDSVNEGLQRHEQGYAMQ